MFERRWLLLLTALFVVLAAGAGGRPAAAGAECPRDYFVAPGDTLSGIAVGFGVTVDEMLACNPEVDDPDVIFVGQRLAVPGNDPPREVAAVDVVDKEHALPNVYVPPALTAIPGGLQAPGISGQQLTADAETQLEAMLAAAAADGETVLVTSAYRDYEEQADTFESYVGQLGYEEASRISALPGHSEHQLGTTADLTSPEVNYQLVEEFGTSGAGVWLAEHAAEFGFALSYPQGSEPLTGYTYEPWHWRYVGVPYAENWQASGLVLVQYLERLLVWGDADCSRALTPADAAALLAYIAGLVPAATPCGTFGALVETAYGLAAWGDFECGTLITGYDALALLLAEAGAAVVQSSPCPEVGSKLPGMY